MPAYLIARIHITDPVRYQEYTKLTPAAIATRIASWHRSA